MLGLTYLLGHEVRIPQVVQIGKSRITIVSFGTFHNLLSKMVEPRPDRERVEALFWAEMHVGEAVIATSMISLSMNSIELELEKQRPAVGTSCSVCVQLHNRQNTDIPVVCTGHISEHTDEGVLFSIESADDPEGLDNLRNIVLFHAHDPKRAAEDLG